MHQETLYELFIGDGYGAFGFLRRPGLGRKDGIRFTDGQDLAIGDGGSICIFTKIFDGIAKSVEGLLDIEASVYLVKPVLEILLSGDCPEAETGSRKESLPLMEKL